MASASSQRSMARRRWKDAHLSLPHNLRIWLRHLRNVLWHGGGGPWVLDSAFRLLAALAWCDSHPWRCKLHLQEFSSCPRAAVRPALRDCAHVPGDDLPDALAADQGS